MDVAEGSFVEIDYEEILTQLKFTSAQFLDFCVMCGTDYNTNIFKVGPDKAYKLLQQYGSIEAIAEANPTLNIASLNHEKTRSLFEHPIVVNTIIPYCGFPNKTELENLYFINNCRFDLERLYSNFNTSIFHEFEFKATESNDSNDKRKPLLLQK